MTGKQISEVTFNGVKTYEGKKLKKKPKDWNSVLSKVFCRINTNLKDQEIFKNKKEGKGQRITHCFSSEFSSDSMTERASSFLVNFCHCHVFFSFLLSLYNYFSAFFKLCLNYCGFSEFQKWDASSLDFGHSSTKSAFVFQTQVRLLPTFGLSSIVSVLQRVAYIFRVLSLLVRRWMILFSFCFKSFTSMVPCSFYSGRSFPKPKMSNFTHVIKKFLFLRKSNYWFNRGSWLD